MRSLTRFAIGIGVATIGVVSILRPVPVQGDAPVAVLAHDSSDVAKVVSDFHNALATGDSAAALRLLAPDAVVLESGGIESRSEYRSHHLPGDIGFARAVKSVRGPFRVIVEGSTAWTVSTSTTEGSFNGRAINSVGAESMVLSKSVAGWRIRSIHWSSRNRRPPTT